MDQPKPSSTGLGQGGHFPPPITRHPDVKGLQGWRRGQERNFDSEGRDAESAWGPLGPAGGGARLAVPSVGPEPGGGPRGRKRGGGQAAVSKQTSPMCQAPNSVVTLNPGL